MTGKKKRVAYYETYEMDFVTSARQAYELPRDYSWSEATGGKAALARVLDPAVQALGRLHGSLHHQRICDERKEAPAAGRGFYVFANHTQPLGDVLLTQVATRPARPYVLASPANLGIPVIGRLLPAFGVLPVPDTVGGLAALSEAVHDRVARGGAVVVFPEAHVWPWYTKVRPLPATPFRFPVSDGAPSYCLTTTYQEPPHGHGKPRITVYLDGPFFPDGGIPARAARAGLRDKVQACMERRSRESTYEYVEYVPLFPERQA